MIIVINSWIWVLLCLEFIRFALATIISKNSHETFFSSSFFFATSRLTYRIRLFPASDASKRRNITDQVISIFDWLNINKISKYYLNTDLLRIAFFAKTISANNRNVTDRVPDIFDCHPVSRLLFFFFLVKSWGQLISGSDRLNPAKYKRATY